MNVCPGTMTSSPGPIRARGHQRQRRGPGGDADAVRDAAVLRELGFELLELGAEREGARAEQAA